MLAAQARGLGTGARGARAGLRPREIPKEIISQFPETTRPNPHVYSPRNYLGFFIKGYPTQDNTICYHIIPFGVCFCV